MRWLVGLCVRHAGAIATLTLVVLLALPPLFGL